MGDSNQRVPDEPLEKIAFSCSGGGYRAASFHLGSMSYLQRLQYKGKPLLENVKMLSTVSGGTITGIVYTLGKQRGKTFRQIYEFLLNRLGRVDLLKEGLDKLNPDVAMKNPFKRKNLINAFSELYDLYFTEGATFAELAEMHCHLEAVVFNSTEFNNAIDFRFRNKDTGYFGNYYIRVNDEAALEVKLADAMAASSCFTGGFEPIVWPYDFRHEGAIALTEIDAAPIGIMDGGIYDNQGIDSILGYKSGSGDPYFDLIIVSDVASPYMTAYAPTEEAPKRGIRNWTVRQVTDRVSRLNWLIGWALPLLMGVSFLLPLWWRYADTTGTGVALALGAVFAILWIVKVWITGRIRAVGSYIQGIWNRLVPPFIRGKLAVLRIEELSIHRLEPLLLDRLHSLLTLMMDVFLKVVRRLNYYKLYEDDRYQYRRIGNLIRELTKLDFDNRSRRPGDDLKKDPGVQAHTILKGDYEEQIGSKINEVAQQSAGFGTTLWFTDKDKLGGVLDNLLATGQFTMCYNMVEYLEQLIFVKDNGFDQLPEQTRVEISGLYQQCKVDWSEFRDDPFYLLHNPDLLDS